MTLFAPFRPWALMLALTVLAVAPQAHAEIGGQALYEAQVPVEDRSREARSEAIREAGLIVLSRITGERYPELQEELSPLVERLEAQVARFSLESTENEGLMLWVRFDPEAMDRLVRQSGHPLWGRERPRTLVWLAMRDGGERRLLTEEEVVDGAEGLVQAAQRRGLPLLFPLMDLEDRAEVSFSDIWGGFDERALAASRRYSPNAILIGRLDHAGRGEWSARWTLYQPDGVVSWRRQPLAQDRALAEGVHETADRLAMRFAVSGGAGEGDGLRLRIRGLDELEDYVAVERYLENLTPVERIRLESLERDTAVFRIQARGGLRSLEQAIELGDRLVRASSNERPEESEGAMVELSPVEFLPTYRLR